MLPTGTILHGNYRIDSYLSSGGFGNTYVATHVLFNETYAIKEFFMKDISERGNDSSSVKVSNAGKTEEFNGQLDKFRKEALRLRKLHNVHIVRVYDLFNENGTSYYVMDLIDGENLKERLQRTGQPMSEMEVRKVLEQVLDALQEVHGQGLWHMDLKPANVMVDQAGVVKLIDFGASKQFNSDTGGAVSTSAVAYTNGYAPREQMERSYDKFGPWTDFYALGAMLYNLLTLKHPPMPGDIDDDTSPDKHVALPMPAKVSPQMRGLVLWLIKTNRKQRPQNVQQIKEFLNPPAPNQTPPPVIDYDAKTLTLNVKGKGNVVVLLNGKEIRVPCTFPQQMQEMVYLITATAQDMGATRSKEVSMRVVVPALKQTPLPVVSYNPKTLTLNATGKGKIRVLLDGKEIQVPFTFRQLMQEQHYNVVATAQEDGEVMSDEMSLSLVIPALKQTPLPEISYDPKSLKLNVSGQGALQVFLDGKEIQVPYTFQRQPQEKVYNVTAIAQGKDELKSEEALLRVVVPALKQTAKPAISYDPKSLKLNVTGQGTLHVFLDGKEIQVPYTFKPQQQEKTYKVTATAQGKDEVKSEEAELSVVVPAMVIPKPVEDTKIDAETRIDPVLHAETKQKPEPKFDDETFAVPSGRPMNPEPEEHKRNKLKVPILAGCVGLLLVVGGYMLFGSGNTDGETEAQAGVEAVNPDSQEGTDESAPLPDTIYVEKLRVKIPAGECDYTGEVNRDSVPNGKGVAVFVANGDKVEAMFTDGNISDDNAVYTIARSKDVFKGSIKDKDFVQGTYIVADGSYFTGTFKGNVPYSGKWYNKNGSFYAEMKNGQMAR